MKFYDVYHALWYWAECCPSEDPLIPSAFESPPIKNRRKKRPTPELNEDWMLWMDVDRVISSLAKNEKWAVSQHVTGMNGRLPYKLGRKLARILSDKGLL